MKRFVRLLWRAMSWSPISHLPWWAKAFNLLWTIPLFVILIGWADDTVHFDAPVTDEDIPGYAEAEPDWNADLRIGDGKCVVVETREVVEC